MKCHSHPEHEAVGICVACGRGVCEICEVPFDGRIYCKDDIARMLTKKKPAGPQEKMVEGGIMVVIRNIGAPFLIFSGFASLIFMLFLLGGASLLNGVCQSAPQLNCTVPSGWYVFAVLFLPAAAAKLIGSAYTLHKEHAVGRAFATFGVLFEIALVLVGPFAVLGPSEALGGVSLGLISSLFFWPVVVMDVIGLVFVRKGFD